MEKEKSLIFLLKTEDHECTTCERIYKSNCALNRHFKTKIHQENLDKLKKLQEINQNEYLRSNNNSNDSDSCYLSGSDILSHEYHLQGELLNLEQSLNNKIIDEKIYDIPLRDKNNKIVGKTIVDKEVYCYIMEKKLGTFLNQTKGCAGIYVGKKSHRLHRYIYYNFYNNKETGKMNVIHKDKDKLNNKINNLMQISGTNNSSGTKRKTATSKYYGITKNNGGDTWSFWLEHEDKNYTAVYPNELHAAYHRDLLIKKLGLQEIRSLNNIKKPEDFVKKKLFKKKDNLPKGVLRYGKNRYYYTLHDIKYNSFATIEEAKKARDDKIKELKLGKINEIKNTPIKRNEKGVAIIELFDINKKKVAETMVDDNIYYELKQHTWHLTGGYVHGRVDKKKTCMSRFIMNYNLNGKVDHIDHNPLNNQKNNLRILTDTGNAQNKSSSKNSSSKYVGVHHCKEGKWRALIKFNGKQEHLGLFKTELEAAYARDKRALELNTHKGTHYNINFK
jgi:hypothetical protein